MKSPRVARRRAASLAIITAIGIAGCEAIPPTNPSQSAERVPMGSGPAFNISQVYSSGAGVTTWDPIPETNQNVPFQTYCTASPVVGRDAAWVNPHNAFVLPGHPWQSLHFSAPWINSWDNLGSAGGNPVAPHFNWTKYSTEVSGNGSFVIRLLADNCSWIYLDGSLVGVQGDDLNQDPSYGLTLNGTHTLEFIIFDGGGLAGGKFSLETTSNPPPPLDSDGDGCPNTEDAFPFDPSRCEPSRAPVAQAGGPYASNETQAVGFAGAGSFDPDNDALTYAWDFGDGGTGVGVSPSHSYADNGTYTVTLIVTDAHSVSSAPAQTTVTVANVAPAATFTEPAPVTEGTPFALTLTSVNDPSPVDVAAGFTFAFDCGTGYGAFAPSSSASCPTTDNGTRTVRGKVQDKDGGVTEYTTTAMISNVAPAMGAVTVPADPVAMVSGGVTVQVSAPFTDPGTGDTHTAAVDCDGGQAGTASASASGGNGTATASCTLGGAGVYSIRLTVTDDDGGSDTKSATQYVVVYDPTGGFVTGGGWIVSPVGAYKLDPSASGKASFGFVSKYHKGAQTPSGNTEFKFHASSFTFKSTVYDWLVVAGAKAQYKGDGTVNGAAGYSFMLTATDGKQSGGGGADKFRIKIWRTSTGAIVYDNATGAGDDIDSANPQVISGGSITIHK